MNTPVAEVEKLAFLCNHELFVIKKVNDTSFLKSRLNLASETDIQTYVEGRIKTMQTLSEVLPKGKEIQIVITPSKKLTSEEYIALINSHPIKLESIRFQSTVGSGIAGVTSDQQLPLLFIESFKKDISDLREKGIIPLDTEFQLIEGIVGITAKISVEDSIPLQEDPLVLLVDVGPEKVVEEYSSNKNVIVKQRNIFYEYEKILLKHGKTLNINLNEILSKPVNSSCAPTLVPVPIDPTDAGIAPDWVDEPEITDENTTHTKVRQYFSWTIDNPLASRPDNPCTSYCDGSTCCGYSPYLDSWWVHEFRREPKSTNIWDFTEGEGGEVVGAAWSNLPGLVYWDAEEGTSGTDPLCTSCGECWPLDGCDEELEIETLDADQITKDTIYVDIVLFQKNIETCSDTSLDLEAEYSCNCTSSPPDAWTLIEKSNCDACGSASCSAGENSLDHKYQGSWELDVGTYESCGNLNNAENGWYKVYVSSSTKILRVNLDVPSNADFDLYIHKDCDSGYICRPFLGTGSDEECNIDTSTYGTGWYYIRINKYSGEGPFTLFTDLLKYDGALCSSGAECSSGYCEGSASYSARCCSSAPPPGGW